MYAVLPSQYPLLGLLALHVGWMLSVNRLVRLPLNLVSGWLTDHLGGRGPYIVGIAIGAVSTAGYGLSSDFWVLLAFRAMWGLSWALLVVAALRMILDVTTAHTRGRLVGIYNSGAFMAGSLGALLGGVLTDAIGFHQAMLILGGLTGLGFLGALTLPRAERTAPSIEAGVRRRSQSLIARLSGLREWGRQLDRSILAISVLNFAHRFFFAGIFYGTLGLYLRGTVGEEIRLGTIAVGVASLTAFLLFIQNVLTMLTAPGAGHLSDRLGDRSPVVILGEITGVAGLIWFALGSSMPTIAVGIVLIATVYGVIPPLVMAWMGDLCRADRRGSTVGIYQTMGDLGSGLGPLVAYWLLERAGIHWVYGISAGCLALTVPLVLGIRRRSPAVRHAQRVR
jgi:MFS family permease